MAEQGSAPKNEPGRSVDADGVVTTVQRHRPRPLAPFAALIGFGLVVLAIGVLVIADTEGLGSQTMNVEATPRAPMRPRASTSTPSLSKPPRAERPPPAARPADSPPSTPAAPPPSEPEVMPMPSDRPPEGRSGLAVFPAAGTKKLKGGVIVPEGYELPPGYVRHYQTTDEGEMLPAVLMFHPDGGPVDENGQPIPVTPDRIVPPEHAPKGMPIHALEPPGVDGE